MKKCVWVLMLLVLVACGSNAQTKPKINPQLPAATTSKPKPLEWPRATPADADGVNIIASSTDSTWRDGKLYRKQEVSKGDWQWVRDEALEKQVFAQIKQQADLLWAFRSRALTDSEMEEVRKLEKFILDPPCFQDFCSWTTSRDTNKDFNDLLVNQYLMRSAKAKSELQDIPKCPLPTEGQNLNEWAMTFKEKCFVVLNPTTITK